MAHTSWAVLDAFHRLQRYVHHGLAGGRVCCVRTDQSCQCEHVGLVPHSPAGTSIACAFFVQTGGQRVRAKAAKRINAATSATKHRNTLASHKRHRRLGLKENDVLLSVECRGQSRHRTRFRTQRCDDTVGSPKVSSKPTCVEILQDDAVSM